MKKKKKNSMKVKDNNIKYTKKKKKTVKKKGVKKVVKKSVKKKVVKKKVVKKKVVKKKVVKKKVVKKKIVKKKVVKKKVKKRVIKKKRTVRKKLFMIDIYPIINKVQLKRKTAVFVSDLKEADIIENTLKDLELIYHRKNMKRQVEFIVKPNKNNIFDNDEDLLDIEYLNDEIPDMDQIFP